MVKHTQPVPRQQPTNCLNVLDHFVGLALKELKEITSQATLSIDLLHQQKYHSEHAFTAIDLQNTRN